jgi:hypothetical protein
MKDANKKKLSKNRDPWPNNRTPPHREMPPTNPDFFRRGEEPIC